MMTSSSREWWTKETKDDDVHDVHDVHNEAAAAAAAAKKKRREETQNGTDATSEKAWKCCEEMHPKKRWGNSRWRWNGVRTREASEEDVGKCEGKSDGNGVQRWYMCRG